MKILWCKILFTFTDSNPREKKLANQIVFNNALGIFIPLFLLTMIVLLSHAGAHAMDKKTSVAEVPEIKHTDEKIESDKLVSIVEKWTDIATKNRLNADYVPGMVTVLYGKELEALGMRTVCEALTLVPGIDISLDFIA